MKTFKEYKNEAGVKKKAKQIKQSAMNARKAASEAFFSKKEKEDPDQKELEGLGMKSAGRGGWSKKEQDRYNDLWMKMHKKGKTPTLSPPSVHGDDSWGTKTKVLQKKLKLTTRDHDGVLA